MDLLAKLKSWWAGVWNSRAIAAARKLLQEFDLTDERQEQIINVVTDLQAAKDAAKKPLTGEQKAQLAAETLQNIHGDYPWPAKVMEFLSTVIKLAWFIAKLSGRLS